MNDAIIIAIISSGALSAIVSGVVTLIAKAMDKRTASAAGLQILLEDRINYLGHCYLKNGFVYIDDLDRLQRMWNVYHDSLKGNGYLDQIMKLVKALPVRPRGLEQKTN